MAYWSLIPILGFGTLPTPQFNNLSFQARQTQRPTLCCTPGWCTVSHRQPLDKLQTPIIGWCLVTLRPSMTHTVLPTYDTKEVRQRKTKFNFPQNLPPNSNYFQTPRTTNTPNKL